MKETIYIKYYKSFNLFYIIFIKIKCKFEIIQCFVGRFVFYCKIELLRFFSINGFDESNKYLICTL